MSDESAFIEFDTEAFLLVNEPVETFLPALAPESAQLMLLDVPYDSQDENRQIGTTTRLKDWFPTMPLAAFEPVFKEAYRVLEKGCHAYVFCDKHSSPDFRRIAAAAGFVFGNELVWDKQIMSSGYNWRGRTERILFFKKGKQARQLNFKTLRGSDLQSYPAIRDDDAYPSEKPVELLESLILNSTQPGEVVCDPFCGSGAAGEAALKNIRRYIATDIELVAVEKAFERLNAQLTAYTDFFKQYGV